MNILNRMLILFFLVAPSKSYSMEVGKVFTDFLAKNNVLETADKYGAGIFALTAGSVIGYSILFNIISDRISPYKQRAGKDAKPNSWFAIKQGIKEGYKMGLGIGAMVTLTSKIGPWPTFNNNELIKPLASGLAFIGLFSFYDSYKKLKLYEKFENEWTKNKLFVRDAKLTSQHFAYLAPLWLLGYIAHHRLQKNLVLI